MDEHLNTFIRQSMLACSNTHISIASNMYLVEEMSSNVYTDVDAEIHAVFR